MVINLRVIFVCLSLLLCVAGEASAFNMYLSPKTKEESKNKNTLLQNNYEEAKSKFDNAANLLSEATDALEKSVNDVKEATEAYDKAAETDKDIMRLLLEAAMELKDSRVNAVRNLTERLNDVTEDFQIASDALKEEEAAKEPKKGFSYLNNIDLLASSDAIDATVEVMEGYLTNSFLGHDHFLVRSTPPLNSTDVKKHIVSSILNKDGGIANISLGWTSGEIVPSLKFITEFGGKIVQGMVNDEIKNIPLLQLGGILHFDTGVSVSKNGMPIDSQSVFILEFPIVYNYVNDPGYVDIFGSQVMNEIFHVDMNLRFVRTGQGSLSIGGTLHSNNKDIHDRAYIMFSLETSN